MGLSEPSWKERNEDPERADVGESAENMERAVVVRIENAYSDGHQSDREVPVDAPSGELEAWFEEKVFPLTGDGHGIGNDLGSCYVATIVRADDASLVGATHEWMD